MKKISTRRKVYISILIFGIIFGLIGVILFTFTPSYSGQIVKVYEKEAVWVIDDTKVYPEDISGKTEKELTEIFDSGTVFKIPSFIPNSLIDELQPGQEVKIFYNGITRLSAPGQANAYWIIP